VLFFFTDHGISHARAKQFCYEEGSHIPLVVWGQPFVGKGVRSELVSHIDIAASSLFLAEPYDVYAREITPFVELLEGPRNQAKRAQAVRDNMALMKQWYEEGK